MGREWWCIVGCKEHGSAPNQLHNAIAVQLYGQGSVYVADAYNDRIQKFQLIDNGCYHSEFKNQIGFFF